MTFLLNREPQKPQTPQLTAKTALSFYYIPKYIDQLPSESTKLMEFQIVLIFCPVMLLWCCNIILDQQILSVL
jgi:hypothetical protein